MKPTPTQQLLWCILALIILINSSCKKINSSSAISADAIILFENTDINNCGWVIKTDSIYSPVNLDKAYQVDSLKVNITYQKLPERLICGEIHTLYTTSSIGEIRLSSIKKR